MLLIQSTNEITIIKYDSNLLDVLFHYYSIIDKINLILINNY